MPFVDDSMTAGAAAAAVVDAGGNLSHRAQFVLTSLPMVLPFRQRAELFYVFVRRKRNYSDLSLRVHREHLMEDAKQMFKEKFTADPSATRGRCVLDP
jgi:hypothetical protein